MCILAFGAGSALSTDDFMKKLPNYERFKCAICHTTSDPQSGNAELNLFGLDFQENDNRWNRDLARKDSDKDTFQNGYEIGDEDGDGTREIVQERSNPGDVNETPAPIDQATWGVIKRLFEDD